MLPSVVNNAFFLSLFSFVLCIPSPDHCYDFTSNTVNDACGSNHLQRVGKYTLYQLVLMVLLYVMSLVASFKVTLTSLAPSLLAWERPGLFLCG